MAPSLHGGRTGGPVVARADEWAVEVEPIATSSQWQLQFCLVKHLVSSARKA